MVVDTGTKLLYSLLGFWVIMVPTIFFYIQGLLLKREYKHYLLMNEVHDFHNKPGNKLSFNEWKVKNE